MFFTENEWKPLKFSIQNVPFKAYFVTCYIHLIGLRPINLLRKVNL